MHDHHCMAAEFCYVYMYPDHDHHVQNANSPPPPGNFHAKEEVVLYGIHIFLSIDWLKGLFPSPYTVTEPTGSVAVYGYITKTARGI